MALSRHPGSKAGPAPLFPTRGRLAIALSLGAVLDVSAEDCLGLGPRSLSSPLFWERCTRAYLGPGAAYRLLQLPRRTGTSPSSHFLARTEAATSFPFLRATLPSLRKRWTRGEPRIARLQRPRCRFLLLAQVCPTAMPSQTRHLVRLAPQECCDELRARAGGPSEGRVTVYQRSANADAAVAHA
jgi:hypothetical protein